MMLYSGYRRGCESATSNRSALAAQRREHFDSRCRSSRPARRAPGFPRTGRRGGAHPDGRRSRPAAATGARPSLRLRQFPGIGQHDGDQQRLLLAGGAVARIGALVRCGARQDRSDAGRHVVRPASASRMRARAKAFAQAVASPRSASKHRSRRRAPAARREMRPLRRARPARD